MSERTLGAVLAAITAVAVGLVVWATGGPVWAAFGLGANAGLLAALAEDHAHGKQP